MPRREAIQMAIRHKAIGPLHIRQNLRSAGDDLPSPNPPLVQR